MPRSSLKSLPTSAPQPIPAEFEQLFIQHGWRRAEHVFGTRPAQRYATYLGIDRLRAARERYLGRCAAAKAGGG